MKNEWKESLAKKYIKEYQLKKVGTDLALRIYSTHLLGNNPELVLHGGGNTSCLLYTSPSPRDRTRSRMPSSA